MKKFILALLLLAPALAQAQPKTIADLQKNYSGKKGVSVVKTSTDMMGLTFADNKDNPLAANVLVLTVETSLQISAADIRRITADAIRIAAAPGNKLIMEVESDEDERVYIYTAPSSKPETLKAVYIIAAEKDEVSVICIEGAIPSNQLAKLTSSAQKMAD